MNILLCTLGASWAVIPEIFGFVAPKQLDLYAHHPQADDIDHLRQTYQLTGVDEIWVCTTEGRQTAESLVKLRAWWQRIGTPLPLRVWTAAGTDQLATQAECDHIRELSLRVTLHASRHCDGGQLMLSLAGGRKTMSADLQWAGTLFGAAALLHVVGPDPLPVALRESMPETFTAPLPAELAAAITPLVVGTANRDDLLDIELNGRCVNTEAFPLPLADATVDCRWPMPVEGLTLTREIQQRQQEGSRLYGNFIAHLAEHESHENWRSLYRLPPARIDELRRTRLSPDHREWLRLLPKADLHRHLGGSLDLAAQRLVGQAVWAALDADQRHTALATIQPLLETTADWPWDWPRLLLRDGQRAAAAAALLVHASNDTLQRNLYAVTEPRVALKDSHPQGFAAYERPGELSGSAILGHPAALAPYARALVEQARAEGLAYLELRGSPHKYRPEAPASFVRDLAEAIHTAGANRPDDKDAPLIRFIWILDRRQPERLCGTVREAVDAHGSANGFLVGLDLAGDEQHPLGEPEKIAPAFSSAFHDCVRITIHAGEGESADNIWQAAYHLHADRIGHGLTLAKNRQLAARLRNRGIGLELCPSSNREVVGFQDPLDPTANSLSIYPLRTFLELGLPATLCTDNPGISRTTLADEYLAAARMTPGGLSRWEALSLIKQGFALAFLPADERETLMKRIDQTIFQRFTEH